MLNNVGENIGDTTEFGNDMSLHPHPTVPGGASQPQIRYSMKIFFRDKGEIKTFLDKGKLGICSPKKLSLKDGFRKMSKWKEIVTEGLEFQKRNKNSGIGKYKKLSFFP